MKIHTRFRDINKYPLSSSIQEKDKDKPQD